MTENELKQYRLIKAEIEDLNFRISDLLTREVQMENTKVKGSLACFPYIAAHFNVMGPELVDQKKKRAEELVRKRETKRLELLEKEAEIHDYIYSIEDGEIRLIFVMTYIDGKTQEEIGRKLHMDRSQVSRKISSYFDKIHGIHK